MTSSPIRRWRGFTLVEVLITLALVGLLGVASLPLYEVTSRRHKEAELRESLRTIRAGLDAYKAAYDAGILPRVAGQSGYPPTLETLTDALQRADSPDRDGTGAVNRLVILRRLPRDPFFSDPLVPAAATWKVRSYASPPDDPQAGDDVFDVMSMASGTGFDGTLYASW